MAYNLTMPILTRALLVVVALICASTHAQQPERYSTMVRLIGSFPLTFQFGLEDALGQRVDLRFGAAFYPVPLILDGDVNVDASANVTYRLGEPPLFLYVGAGPRYSRVETEWIPGRGEVGSYVGAGAVAGLGLHIGAFGAELLNILLEVNGDYTFGITPGATRTRFSPRVAVGIDLPIVGLGAGF